MTKLKHLLQVLLFLLIALTSRAQKTYAVQYITADTATAGTMGFLKSFPSRIDAMEYVAKLPATLQAQGYITVSVDSTQFDSTSANVYLFLGQQYKWARINTQPEDDDILSALRWNSKTLSGTGMNFTAIQALQENILSYLEDNGHPFAKIYLDSINLVQNEITADLKIIRGPLYKIDSIRVFGDAKIDNEFLQRYLDIKNESIYSKKKLAAINKRIAELTYIQETHPPDITLLGTGSVLNLYLKAKKSSQVNVLLGLLPNSNAAVDKKFLVTGEANILLRNALGSGETIGLNWQQLQQSSPRLNILYDHPFVFHSPLGLNFTFDMFRKDTTFLNINLKLGAAYVVDGAHSANIFLQRRSTIVNGVNVQQIMVSKKLPQDADVSSLNLGLTYDVYATDYRFNPRKGNELTLTTSAGTKNLKKNNQVLELKDPGNPNFKYESLYDTVKLKTYQFRVVAYGAHYFAVGRQSSFKTALNAGLYSSGNIFRNELFQIGGYKLLRGFDEESQYASQYAVATAEYRYLIGRNSAFFGFTDGGWARHPLEQKNHAYIGFGTGLSFETKAGIFNILWAVGRRDDVPLNLRESKIHLGFVNYF